MPTTLKPVEEQSFQTAVEPATLSSLFDQSNLTSQQIAGLSGKGRARNAGEGLTDFQTAQDQIRFEELELIREDTKNESFRKALHTGEVSFNVLNLPKGQQQNYLNTVLGNLTPEQRTQFLTDAPRFAETYNNLFNSLGPVAAANAIIKIQEGTIEEDVFTDTAEISDDFLKSQ